MDVCVYACIQAAGRSLKDSLVKLLRPVIHALRLRAADLNEVHGLLFYWDEAVKSAHRVRDGLEVLKTLVTGQPAPRVCIDMDHREM